MRIGAILSVVRIWAGFRWTKVKQNAYKCAQMKTLQEAVIRHSIIAEVALHALALEERADGLLHDRRRRVDDHEVESVERGH